MFISLKKTVVAFYKKGISCINCHSETTERYNLCCHNQPLFQRRLITEAPRLPIIFSIYSTM